MDATLRDILWRQFGASIDMLGNTLRACPDPLWQISLWDDEADFAKFWYLGYHTLFWLDFYLSGSEAGFAPPAPFTLDELEPGLLPDRPYTRDELLTYLEHGREKCRLTIAALTDDKAAQPCRVGRGELSFAELLLYNMRHVQEHAAQLSLFLGQQIGWSPRWVAKAEDRSGNN